MKNSITTLILALFFLFACNQEVIMPESSNGIEDQIEYDLLNELDNDAVPIITPQRTGYDEWGFNYKTHMFNGYLINAYFGDPEFTSWAHYKKMVYKGEGIGFWFKVIAEFDYFPELMPPSMLNCKLTMRWNEALLSKDAIYPDHWTDSDAWIEFFYALDDYGQKWQHYRKLAAFSSTDTLIGDYWFDQDGREIGMKSYYWTDQLMIIQVKNRGENPYVPSAMPDNYIVPNSPVQTIEENLF